MVHQTWATEWSVQRPPKESKHPLTLQLWSQHRYPTERARELGLRERHDFRSRMTQDGASRSWRYGGAMFYGYNARVTKWGWDRRRKALLLWTDSGAVINCAPDDAFSGKSAVQWKKVYHMLSHMPQRLRVPCDQFPPPLRPRMKFPNAAPSVTYLEPPSRKFK